MMQQVKAPEDALTQVTLNPKTSEQHSGNEFNPTGQQKIETNPRASQQRAFASLYALYTSYPTWYESFAEANKPDAPKSPSSQAPESKPSLGLSQQKPVVLSAIAVNVLTPCDSPQLQNPSVSSAKVTKLDATKHPVSENQNHIPPPCTAVHGYISLHCEVAHGFDVKLNDNQILALAIISDKFYELQVQQNKPGLTLEVTSGERSYREEAEADYPHFMKDAHYLSEMSKKSPVVLSTVLKLEKMISDEKTAGIKDDLIITDIADFIRDADRKGVFYSKNHPNGLAVDVSTSNLTSDQCTSLENMINDKQGLGSLGFHAVKEHGHLHVTIPYSAISASFRPGEHRGQD